MDRKLNSASYLQEKIDILKKIAKNCDIPGVVNVLVPLADSKQMFCISCVELFNLIKRLSEKKEI